MTDQNAQMTREAMQDEALVIECLLDTAQAMFGERNHQDMLTMVEMAHGRAKRLNIALDHVNAPAEIVEELV